MQCCLRDDYGQWWTKRDQCFKAPADAFGIAAYDLFLVIICAGQDPLSV
jgi:hypothetical protein